MNKLLTLLLIAATLASQQLSAQVKTKAQVGHARLLGKSKPLIEYPLSTAKINKTSNKAKAKMNKPTGVPNFQGNVPMPSPHAATALPQGPDPLVGSSTGSRSTVQIIPELVIDGIDENDSQIYPPDPSGYIGANHYLQSTNHFNGTVFEIFDKSGVSVFGPTNTAPFWEDFNIVGFGDPVIVYDHQYERWLITEFGPFGTSVFLIAVSETSDPTGSWYAYQFQAPDFPDYPKYSVWNNSYLITSNEPSATEIPVYVLNRDQMVAGAAQVDMVRLPALPKFNTFDAFQVASPVCWDGPVPPPTNEPGYVVRIYDDAWEGGNDGLELWKIHVDWTDPDAAFAEGPIFLQTAPFDSKVCNGSIFDCIAQPDGTTMSALEQVVMHRTSYRNFGSHESIVLNHVVDVNGNNLVGIRWYELRRVPGGDWTVYQQGTFSPDEDHRFMGSIAMDLNGNMLMAYSVVGPDQLLSLRFTGRLAGDPLGEMTVEEYEFGTGLSLNPSFRWGDYSAMTVDPIDNRTFWFTGEYMKANSIWGTKIMKALVNRDSNDVGPQRLKSPISSGYLTNAEQITVELRNYGYKPAADFTVSMMLNGNLLATETITDTIASDSVRLHTFVPTIDMSAIGAYPLTFYTSYAYDTVFVNDTLRAVVQQLTRNDAAVAGFSGLDFPICDLPAEIGIVISNAGVDTLYSVNVTYQINGGTPITINWTGALPPGESETILITTNDVVAGTNTIAATVSDPNGVPDEDTTDDSLSRDFEVITGGGEIVLTLLTDNYPNETSWELFDLNGNVLYSGGGYTGTQTTYVIPMCVPEGCYIFSIYDTFGDGMYWPPDGVMGHYEITNGDGIVIANLANADFGNQEDNDFCTDGTCLMEITASVTYESAPGASDGFAFIDIDNGVAPFQFSIDGGATFQSSPIFDGLAPGVYPIEVRDTSGCLMKDTFTVGTCTMLASFNATQPATSISNDGSITVTATNGNPPYSYRLNNGSSQTSNVFNNLDEGTYTVNVTDATGCISSQTITLTATTDSREVVFGTSIKVYPNPTSGVFKVEVAGLFAKDELPVRLLNAQGQAILNHRLTKYDGVLTGTLSLKFAPAGVYFLQMVDETSGLNHLVRIVKQ